MLIGSISAAIILCNLFLKKSKLLYAISFLWMWILMAGTYGIADESIYISRYNSPEMWSSTTEFLYNWIIIVCNRLGLDFITFKAITAFVQLVLIFSTVWVYASYPNLVVALYFVFPFPLHVAQMRNALATAIFTYGFRYLIQEESDEVVYRRKRWLTTDDIKFIVVILLASAIHTASIGWMILLVAKKMSIKINSIICLVMNILIIYVLSPQNLLKIINVFGGGGRISAYFSEAYQASAYRQYGSLVWIVVTFAFIIGLCFYISLFMKKTYNIKQMELLMKCNISILYIIGVVIRYTSEIYRLQEGLNILNIILLSNSIYGKQFHAKKMAKTNMIVIFGLVVYTMGIAFVRYYPYLISTIIIPLLQNNRFF